MNEKLSPIVEKLQSAINLEDWTKVKAILEDNISWHADNEEFVLYCLKVVEPYQSKIFSVAENELDAIPVEEWTRDYLYTLQSLQLSEYSLDRYMLIWRIQRYLDDGILMDSIKYIEKHSDNTVYKINGDKNVNFTLAVGVGITLTALGLLLLLRKKR